MDHRRIEWLLLVLFLLVDIYLGVDMWNNPISLETGSSAVTTTTSLKSEMKSDNITLPKLSRDSRSGYYLASQGEESLNNSVKKLSSNVETNYSASDQTLYGTLRIPISLQDMSLNKFKNNTNYVPNGKRFQYVKYLSTNSSYVYVQKSQYGQIYSNLGQLTITVKDGQITGFYETYLSDLSSVRELQSTVSQWRAVTSLYTNRQLPNNSKVLKVTLGYTKLTKVRGSTIFIPTWLIWIENKSNKNTTLKRVNAFNGQYLQGSSLDDN